MTAQDDEEGLTVAQLAAALLALPDQSERVWMWADHCGCAQPVNHLWPNAQVSDVPDPSPTAGPA